MAEIDSTPEIEEWRAIPECDGFYEASSLGRIRSVGRVVAGRRLRGKVLSPGRHCKGYLGVCLYLKGGVRCLRVHSLVLMAFSGPSPSGMEALHGDDNPANNRPENLKWGTHAENQRQMSIRGRSPQGERQGNSKLSTAKVLAIRELAGAGVSSEAIGNQFGIGKNHVSRIVRMQAWAHLRPEEDPTRIAAGPP